MLESARTEALLRYWTRYWTNEDSPNTKDSNQHRKKNSLVPGWEPPVDPFTTTDYEPEHKLERGVEDNRPLRS